MLQVKQIIMLMNEIAPEQAAMDFDNCGLLVGSESDMIDGILFALDVSSEVIDEAVRKNCKLIITHHPLIFKPEKKITDATYQGGLLLKLIKAGVDLYSLHTPLDATSGGCNDVLCNIFGLKNIKGIDRISSVNGTDYYCGRIGELSTTPESLAEIAKEKLSSRSVRIINGGRKVGKIAICSGSGGSCINEALRAGADCFITGELSYHDAQKIKEAQISAVLCGHYETENPVIDEIIRYLQDRINMLQYSVDLVRTEISTDPFDL